MSQLENAVSPNSKPITGFWIYLMTDCMLFGSLFATFIVLRGGTNGGPSGQDLFDMPFVLAETLILLVSSYVCGLAVLSMRRGLKKLALTWLLVTILLGVSFLTLEITEFHSLVAAGHSWTTSSFLSAFFTLVATHGAHITAGLMWAIFMMVMISKRGITPKTARQLTMFSMFWHFLDVIWIFIFTIVYSMGVLG
jgi:cytochrome o ubiquinol oxidase subunit 3